MFKKLWNFLFRKKKEEKPIVLKETVAPVVGHCGAHKYFVKGCHSCLRAVGVNI
jgi:hypothetical protein